MRWCSRKTAGDISAVEMSAGFADASDAVCGPRDGGEAVQAASASESAAKPPWASLSFLVPQRRQRARRTRMGPVPMGPESNTATSQSLPAAPAAPSLASAELYLLRPHRFDPRATALFDPATDPYLPAGEGLGFKPRRREITLISLQDRNGEILGPAPPEIHIDVAPLSRTERTLPSTSAKWPRLASTSAGSSALSKP